MRHRKLPMMRGRQRSPIRKKPPPVSDPHDRRAFALEKTSRLKSGFVDAAASCRPNTSSNGSNFGQKKRPSPVCRLARSALSEPGVAFAPVVELNRVMNSLGFRSNLPMMKRAFRLLWSLSIALPAFLELPSILAESSLASPSGAALSAVEGRARGTLAPSRAHASRQRRVRLDAIPFGMTAAVPRLGRVLFSGVATREIRARPVRAGFGVPGSRTLIMCACFLWLAGTRPGKEREIAPVSFKSREGKLVEAWPITGSSSNRMIDVIYAHGMRTEVTIFADAQLMPDKPFESTHEEPATAARRSRRAQGHLARCGK